MSLQQCQASMASKTCGSMTARPRPTASWWWAACTAVGGKAKLVACTGQSHYLEAGRAVTPLCQLAITASHVLRLPSDSQTPLSTSRQRRTLVNGRFLTQLLAQVGCGRRGVCGGPRTQRGGAAQRNGLGRSQRPAVLCGQWRRHHHSVSLRRHWRARAA